MGTITKTKIPFAPKSPTSPSKTNESKKHNGVIISEQFSTSAVVKIQVEYGKICVSMQLNDIKISVNKKYLKTKI